MRLTDDVSLLQYIDTHKIQPPVESSYFDCQYISTDSDCYHYNKDFSIIQYGILMQYTE
jgi:hypothetical protein